MNATRLHKRDVLEGLTVALLVTVVGVFIFAGTVVQKRRDPVRCDLRTYAAAQSLVPALARYQLNQAHFPFTEQELRAALNNERIGRNQFTHKKMRLHLVDANDAWNATIKPGSIPPGDVAYTANAFGCILVPIGHDGRCIGQIPVTAQGFITVVDEHGEFTQF